MKLNKIILGIAAAGMAVGFAVPSQAAVLDAWQMVITGDTYSNIGRLSITAGSSTVIQETDAAGNIFAGAQFSENGLAYNISYVQDNIVGPGDSGPVTPFGATDWLQMTFTNVTGVVTSTTGAGGFGYVFTGGDFSLTNYLDAAPSVLATGSIVGNTGTFADNFGIAGANGSSVLDILLASIAGGSTFNLLDSGGNPIDISTVVFEAQTNNQLTENVPAVTTTCGATGFANCIYLNNINSNGDAFLTTVPEPATLALMGLGLVGMGVSLRRRKA